MRTNGRKVIVRARLGAAGGLAAATGMFAMSSVPARAGTLPSCTTRSFQVRKVYAQAALGTVYLALSYRNISHRTCASGGFPGITLYSRGRELTVGKGNSGLQYSTLRVEPGQRVFNVVGYSQTSFGTRSCPAVTGVKVSAPNSSQSVRVHLGAAGEYCKRGAFIDPLASSARRSMDPDA
jgi:hypothetical protein